MKEPVIAGNGIYATCCNCGKFIRINKPLLGSLHICADENELAATLAARRAIRAQLEDSYNQEHGDANQQFRDGLDRLMGRKP